MKTCVKDIMTTYVVAVRPSASFKEMAARLHEFRVSAFPVVDDEGKVLGVVSEDDLLAKEAVALTLAGMPAEISERIAHRLHRSGREADGLTAGELMTSPAVTTTPDTPVENAARSMYNFRVKRLPVVNPDGRLVGIVSRSDVLSVFDRSDEEIRKEIVDDVILHGFLQDPRMFAVTVKAGVVTMQGSPETAALGRDIVRMVRHVQGVVAVRDRLSYTADD
ncbi:MAG: CBS domain-containing protein [Streptosporangiaceae bacterium]